MSCKILICKLRGSLDNLVVFIRDTLIIRYLRLDTRSQIMCGFTAAS